MDKKQSIRHPEGWCVDPDDSANKRKALADPLRDSAEAARHQSRRRLMVKTFPSLITAVGETKKEKKDPICRRRHGLIEEKKSSFLARDRTVHLKKR